MASTFGFWGSKGYVGKSYCAFNFARCLSEELDARVLLIDGNYPLSADFNDYYPDLEYETLDKEFAGVVAHAAPIKFLDLEVIGLFSDMSQKQDKKELGQFFKKKLQSFANDYDYIVIDLGGAFGDYVGTLIDSCTHLFVVCDDRAESISRLNKDSRFLKNVNISTDKLSVVVNKYTQSNITQEWIYNTVGLSVDGFIPSDKTVQGIESKKGRQSDAWEAFQRLVLRVEQIKKFAKEKAIRLKQEAASKFDNEIHADYRVYNELKLEIHKRLLEVLDLKQVDTQSEAEKRRELEQQIREQTINIINEISVITDRALREEIVEDLIKESLYLGVLEDLLSDEDISEVMVNRWDTIYVERKGKVTLSPHKFLSEQQLMRIIERIVAPLGRRVDISSPLVDARLQDGSRVNIIIPPLAPNGAVMTIRKFAKEALQIQDLINFGTINEQVVEFLRAAVISKKNIIISGGTGSGKTTTLNILSSFIPEGERIITVEDSAELSLQQPHVITLETRPKNIEGKGEVSIRELVKNTLRMRPDRIVVGECRAGEALDMLQAMNTGHDGSMTTVHANSTREMLSRLETLVMYAGTELPSKAIREQIRGAVHIVLQISRLSDGSRKVLQISEVTGMQDGDITFENVFVYEQKGVAEDGKIYGDFVSTGYVPSCLEEFKANGIDIPKEVFWAH